MAAFPSKPIAVISYVSIVVRAAILCVFVAMCMGSWFCMYRRPAVALKVYTKAGDAASGSRYSFIDSTDPTSGVSRGSPLAVLKV